MKKSLNVQPVLLTVAVLALSGCATESKSVGTGAGIGALGGAGIGAIADPGRNGQYRTRNVVIGATVGAMAGMVTGSLMHKHSEEEKAKAFTDGKKSGPAAGDSTPPKLADPKIEARFIDGKAQGNRYIGPHWEYILVEPARWAEGQ